MEWKTYRISEIASIKSGKRLPAGHDFCLEPTAYPYIRARDIKDGRINRDNLAYISQETQSKIKKYIVNNADIVITIVGVSIGDTAFVTTDFEGMNLTENAVRLTNFSEKVNSEYLAYYLGQSFMKHYMEVLASGAAQAKLGIYKIEKIKVSLPPLPIQQRIASILSSYDNLIEINNRRIKLLEQMAEMVYKEWFVRFRFPGYEKCKMVDGLPEGWKIERLDQQYSTTSGGTPSRSNSNFYEGNIPWIKTGELQNTFIHDTEEHITEEAVRKSSAKIFPSNSLLIAMYAGANVGNLGFNVIPATCNQACCVINPKGELSNEYLFFFLQTQKDYLQTISFGAAQQNISQDIIKKLKIVVPDVNIVKQFTSTIAPIFTQINTLQSQNANLARQRDMLLPRLMSGKIELK